MALFDIPLDLITEQHLAGLIDAEVREGYRIEYKRELALGTEEGKGKLLATISSFANSSGGDLVIGMSSDAEGLPLALTGWVGINIDNEKLRIENLVQNGLDPRVHLALSVLILQSEEPVFIVRVSRSWTMPHMVKSSRYFYYRHSAGKAPMDLNQLRAAFGLTNQIGDRINQFRQRRTDLLKERLREDSVEKPAAAIVAFFIPFDAMLSGHFVDLEKIKGEARGLLNPLGGGSNGLRHNVDGILNLDSSHPSTSSDFTQLFRNGAIESVNRSMAAYREPQPFLPSTSIHLALTRKLRDCFALARLLAIHPPAVVSVALLNVHNFKFAIDDRFGPLHRYEMDRPDIVLPELVLNDFDGEPETVIRPLLDSLWQAAGLERCFAYDELGTLRE